MTNRTLRNTGFIALAALLVAVYSLFRQDSAPAPPPAPTVRAQGLIPHPELLEQLRRTVSGFTGR